jgi:hypothetical protein
LSPNVGGRSELGSCQEEDFVEKHLEALKAEVKNRARIYYLIYRELCREVGEERALVVLKRAIYQRGAEKGLQLAIRLGGSDLSKLAEVFVEGKEGVDVFGHQVVRVDQDHALLRLNQCPLVEAWRELGLSPEVTKVMCDLAYQVDFGKFETAGFRLKFDCRIADGEASCDLRVTK